MTIHLLSYIHFKERQPARQETKRLTHLFHYRDNKRQQRLLPELKLSPSGVTCQWKPVDRAVEELPKLVGAKETAGRGEKRSERAFRRRASHLPVSCLSSGLEDQPARSSGRGVRKGAAGRNSTSFVSLGVERVFWLGVAWWWSVGECEVWWMVKGKKKNVALAWSWFIFNTITFTHNWHRYLQITLAQRSRAADGLSVTVN